MPREQEEDLLLQQAYYDSVTGLPNRVLFDYRLRQTMATSHKTQNVLAVLSLNLDGLKKINHTYGHSTGDWLLQQVAERLGRLLNPGDMLARLGGDEFLMLTEVTQVVEARKRAKRILDQMRLAFPYRGNDLYVTISVGVSLFPVDGEDAEVLIRCAQSALARAKREGKNNYQLYTSSMETHAVRRLALENSLRTALQRDEFVVYYQPQLDIRTGQIVGAEALVRWKVPEYGLVSPAEFIPIAEESGLIVPIGEWVLRTACAQNKMWQRMGLTPLRMAVNLSARQFQQQDLAQSIQQALKDTGLEPTYLDLEITESYAMQNADFTRSVLHELKRHGVRIAIDDFGTGYSSLSYLKHLPIDTLKIDRSFVRDLSTDPHDAAIAAAIIVLAHNLKLQVLAEGVESEEELVILRQHQCDLFQGYLFSPPVSAEAFERLMRSGRCLYAEPSRKLA